MALEKLTRQDKRLVLICAIIAAVSLVIGIRYYSQAFPESSIDFRVTRETSEPIARAFLQQLGLNLDEYRHAAIFNYDNQAKVFLEREVGVAESNRLLESTIRLWRWEHRWFRPLQKEEMDVAVTTKGEVVGFLHLLPEEAAGASLSQPEAQAIAEQFLATTMHRDLNSLTFVEGSTEKKPNRIDHSFTWKLKGSEVKGADYRISVEIAGQKVVGYHEHLKVPDTWIRSYQKLRSRNETAGQIDAVLLLLTFIAMLIVLGLKIRRRDIRWRPAALLGGVIFVLLALSQLNSLPSSLFRYDTTASYGGFLLRIILQSLLTGFAGGAAIFLLAASAEPLYRERFPQRLSLTSLVRLEALRTREFFRASLVGITLTFFFFAYENIFYIIANALGAWSPRDVAYSDLLSTAFPWVYVLFFGLFPALSEEFMSRMFSIPFFEKILKSTTAALIIAAFIWGFGHATYPNQPFWIRGLEVGLAGIVFGLVLLRFGIMSVVICHFSVDALYSAFVLIRSPNLYYKISGTLSAGIFVLLFLGAALAYWRKGGFLPGAATNQAEGVAAEVPAEERPAAVERPVQQYRAMSPARLAVGLILALLLGLFALAPPARFGDWVSFSTTPDQARLSARNFLSSQGFDVSGYRDAVTVVDRTDSTAAQYLYEQGGRDLPARVYARLVPSPLWKVRLFVPEQHEEFSVFLDPRDDSVAGFQRTLSDEVKGASLSSQDALQKAEDFLASRGIHVTPEQLKEQTAKDQKARRDYTLAWEVPIEGGGEARTRYTVVIQGARVGASHRLVKIPEEWRRNREKETAGTALLGWLVVPFFVILGGLAIYLLAAKLRSGEIPWRFALWIGGLGGAATVIRLLVDLDRLWNGYPTSYPVRLFYVGIAVSLFVGMIVFFLGSALVAGMCGALFPRSTRMFRRSSRQAYARDALLAGLITLGFVQGLPLLAHWVENSLPGGFLIQGVAWPSSLATRLPLLWSLARAFIDAIFVSGMLAVLVAILKGPLKNRLAWALLAVLFVLGFLPHQARGFGEYAAAACGLLLLAAGSLVLIRFFLADNPLAWVWSAFFAFGVAAALNMLEQPNGWYHLNGWLLLTLILVPALVLLRDAFQNTASSGPVEEMASLPDEAGQ